MKVRRVECVCKREVSLYMYVHMHVRKTASVSSAWLCKIRMF